jgi:hypothetical protein
MIKYCTCIKTFCEEITIIVSGVKRQNRTNPTFIYYSHYIRHKFVFLCLKYHENLFEPKQFYTSTIVDHLLFLEGFGFFSILNYHNFWVYPKFASVSVCSFLFYFANISLLSPESTLKIILHKR